jgi:hypothetical protein
VEVKEGYEIKIWNRIAASENLDDDDDDDMDISRDWENVKREYEIFIHR